MQDFTSLSPQEEQAFLVFERRSVNTGRAASMLALIIAGALFVVTVFVVFAFKPANMHNVVDEAAAKDKVAAEAKAAEKAAAKAAPAPATEETPAAADESDEEESDDDESDEKAEE